MAPQCHLRRRLDRPSSTNPFASLRARSLLVWLAVAVPIAIVTGLIVMAYTEIEPFASEGLMVTVELWLAGTFVAWLAFVAGRHRLNLLQLFGSPSKGFNWWTVPVVVAASMAFSPGSGLVLAYYLPWYREYVALTNGGGPPRLAVLMVTLVVVAPVFEELLFRGILLHRLAHRWSVAGGVLAPSIVFGALHLDIVGATVFGIVMCVLYVHAGSLLVPIAAHALNNLVSVLLIAAASPRPSRP